MATEGTEFEAPPESRDEAILYSILQDEPYTAEPESRIEDLLIQLKGAIEDSGSGAIASFTSTTAKCMLGYGHLTTDNTEILAVIHPFACHIGKFKKGVWNVKSLKLVARCSGSYLNGCNYTEQVDLITQASSINAFSNGNDAICIDLIRDRSFGGNNNAPVSFQIEQIDMEWLSDFE